MPKHTRSVAAKRTLDARSNVALRSLRECATGSDHYQNMRVVKKVAKRLGLKRKDRVRLLRVCSLILGQLGAANDA